MKVAIILLTSACSLPPWDLVVLQVVDNDYYLVCVLPEFFYFVH
ncbi:MAG: hypothetical protein ACE5R6_06725 [Candidatus Heimdallarchaeota archaeon]